jgi:hypothetical protein
MVGLACSAACRSKATNCLGPQARKTRRANERNRKEIGAIKGALRPQSLRCLTNLKANAKQTGHRLVATEFLRHSNVAHLQ